MRIALGLEYDGAHFQGFQSQKDTRTVQIVLEKALSSIANKPIQVCCAGRTDAFVHALNQVVHFDTFAKRPLQAWILGTNSLLPKDVVVKWGREVDEQFHARFSAINRHYRYIICNQKIRPTILRDYVTHWAYPLEKEKMHIASQYLLGEHDFSSFRGADCQAKTTMRRIDRVEILEKGEIIMIDIIANAFLHHMVRNIVGVLFKVGMCKKEPSWMFEIMGTHRRTHEFITAPPQGLYLVNVGYPERFQIPILNFDTEIFDVYTKLSFRRQVD